MRNRFVTWLVAGAVVACGTPVSRATAALHDGGAPRSELGVGVAGTPSGAPGVDPILPAPEFGEFGVQAPRPPAPWAFPWESEESDPVKKETPKAYEGKPNPPAEGTGPEKR